MRVLCHAVHGKLSIDMIRPIADQMKARGDEVFWSYAETSQADTDVTLKALAGETIVPSSTASDIVLHADPRCAPQNGAPVFEVPHGINSKKGYFRPDVQYECDFHMASSYWIAERMSKWHRKTTFLPIGIPKLDCYAQGEPVERDSILICATHTNSLTLWHSCRDQIIKLSEKMPVILRFHPHVYEKKREWLEGIPSNLEIDRSDSIGEVLRRAKAVVSDVSSAGMEALGLGLPVVRFETESSRAHLENPDVLEAQFNEFFTRISDPRALEEAIAASAPAPEEVQGRLIINVGTAAKTAMEAIDGISL